jgi:hypothetical protein
MNWKKLASSEYLSAILVGGVIGYGFITFLLVSGNYQAFHEVLGWVFK